MHGVKQFYTQKETMGTMHKVSGIAPIVRFLVILVYRRYTRGLFGGYRKSSKGEKFGGGGTDG